MQLNLFAISFTRDVYNYFSTQIIGLYNTEIMCYKNINEFEAKNIS